jgi:hypothetical protein
MVLLPVPGRSRASALLRPAGRNGDSIVLGTPRAQVLLPVPGRSRDKPRSYALRAEPGDSVVAGTPRAQVLLPVSGRSRASALLRPAGRTRLLSCGWHSACTGFAAGFRQIAGQATLLRPAGRNGDSIVLGTPRAQVLLPVPGRSRGKPAPTPCGQNQSLQKKLYMQREEDSCYGLRPESRAELISRTQPKTVGANLFARGKFSRQGSVGRTSLSRMNSLPQG